VKDINEHMCEQDVQEAEASIDYLESKLQETNIAGMQQVFYQLIESENRTVMMANSQQEYVFKTIDPAVVPQEKIEPKRAIICILATLLGVFLVFLLAVFLVLVNKGKTRTPQPMNRKALITGITGQDGSYLAEFLLEKGYEVHGIKRRASSFNTQRVDHIYQDPHVASQNFVLHYGDLTDFSNLTRILQEVQPDEVYNLGAQSHVAVSFEAPEYTADVDAMGTLRLLEAIRLLGLEKKTRFYQASTSELFGEVQETPQKETTSFHPGRLMRWPNSMPTGLPLTTGRPTASTPVTAYCSTMNPRAEVKPL